MKSMDADINFIQRPIPPLGSLVYRPFSMLTMQFPVINHQQLVFLNQPPQI